MSARSLLVEQRYIVLFRSLDQLAMGRGETVVHPSVQRGNSHKYSKTAIIFLALVPTDTVAVGIANSLEKFNLHLVHFLKNDHKPT